MTGGEVTGYEGASRQIAIPPELNGLSLPIFLRHIVALNYPPESLLAEAEALVPESASNLGAALIIGNWTSEQAKIIQTAVSANSEEHLAVADPVTIRQCIRLVDENIKNKPAQAKQLLAEMKGIAIERGGAYPGLHIAMALMRSLVNAPHDRLIIDGTSLVIAGYGWRVAGRSSGYLR